MRGLEIFQHSLDEEFRGAIGVDWILRRILPDRESVWDTISGAGARKHEVPRANVAHRLQECQRAYHIVPVILSGVGHGFPDISEGSKVHHRFRFIAAHDFVEPCSIKDVALFERPPSHGPFVAVDKIIVGDGQVACTA